MQPYGQQPTRLLCPRDSPSKNTGVGCHFLSKQLCYRLTEAMSLVWGYMDSACCHVWSPPSMPRSENTVWRRRQGGEVGTRPEIGSLPPYQSLDLDPCVIGDIWGHGKAGHILDMSIVQPKEPKSGKPLQRAQLSSLYSLLNEYFLRATLCQPDSRHWGLSSEHRAPVSLPSPRALTC